MLSFAALALASWVARALFMDFLDGPYGGLAPGLAGLVVRLGVLVIGLGALDAYEVVLGERGRAVLDYLPVDPRSVIRFCSWRLIRERVWVLGAIAIVLWPVAWDAGWLAWAAAVGALWSLQIAAWPVSIAVFLAAVGVADNPRWHPVLDAIRGANPRSQAAFLYAPGVVLIFMTVLLAVLSGAVGAIVTGQAAAGAAFAIGPVVAAGVALRLPSLAQKTWYPAAIVLTDIASRWAAIDAQDVGREPVYLEWAARFWPTSWRSSIVFLLRRGWRAHRLWALAPWGFAVLVGFAGWSESPSAVWRAALAGVLGLSISAGILFVFERNEPSLLRWWIPTAFLHAWRAGAAVAWMWGQPMVAALAMTVLVYRSVGDALLAWIAMQGVAGLVAGLASGSARAGRFGLGGYTLAVGCGIGVMIWRMELIH